LGIPQTWAFTIPKGLTDPIWWFYLYWLPDFFSKQYHLDLKHLGLPLIFVYTASSVGSIGGGWLPSYLISKGISAQRARLSVMLLFALLVFPVFLINYLGSEWIAIGLLSLAAAAHQGWSANLFTTASDMFPRKAIGSVTGIGSMAGAVCGFAFAKLAGHLLQVSNSYAILFLIAASVYLVSWVFMVLLAPGLKRVEVAL
jgi:ACS family hexuronate transporter-like MFS transporter